MSAARGITFLEPVQAQLVTRQEMTDYLVSTIDAEDREYLAKMQELYRALGLLDQRTKLYPLYLELLGEQVRGLFNLETEELLVVGYSFSLKMALVRLPWPMNWSTRCSNSASTLAAWRKKRR